ncbi:MAG: hypothetical protein AB7S26_28945 [Sandaracinaceae bacterium]
MTAAGPWGGWTWVSWLEQLLAWVRALVTNFVAFLIRVGAHRRSA